MSTTPEEPPSSLGEFLELLELEELDKLLYRAHNPERYSNRFRLFGGQVAAQALRAATLTVEDGRLPHSMHGYFLRPGRTDRPTIMRVERDRDGRSVSARRVTAIQDGEAIFTMSASFHNPGEGPVFHPGIPDGTPRPEDCDAIDAFGHPGMFELRPIGRRGRSGLGDSFWAKADVTLPDDPVVHACVLTFLSDMGIPEADIAGQLEEFQSPSVDHAVWFHRHIRMDDWVLFTMHMLSAGSGRGLYRGSLYSADGVLGATMVQEALFRPIPEEMARMFRERRQPTKESE